MLNIKIITLVLVSVVTLSVASDTAYLSQNTQLFKDNKHKQSLGKLFVASKVEVISKNSDYSKIEFIGYAPEDSPLVYEKVGLLIRGFKGSSFSNYKTIGKEVDEYDTEWFKIRLRGYVKNEFLEKSKTKLLSSGKKLFEQKCSTCHNLQHKDEFSQNVWPSILQNMEAQAGLSNNERMIIEKYLQDQ